MAQSYPIITQQPTGASAAVRFFPLQTYYAASAQTSNGPANSVMLGSGVLENFFVDRKGTPPSAGTTVTYDLLKNNNTATPVASITLNDTQSFGSDVVSSVAYTDGDLFCWRVTPSGSAGNVSWESGCEAISSNDGQALVTGSSTATNSTNPQYANLQQDGLLNVLGGGSIMPFDGSLTKFAMNCSIAPGAGKDFTATLMKRTRATGAVASTGFTIQVADANTQTITTPSPIPFLQGDIFWWENTPTGSPSSSIRISLAALQVPTIPGMSMHSFGTSSNSSASQTVSATILYATVGGGNGSSAETTRVAPNTGTYVQRNLTVWNELTPAGSNEITYNSRANGVDIGTVIMLPSTSPLYLEDNTSQVTVNPYEKVGLKFQRTAGSGTATIGLMSAGFAMYKAPVSGFKPKTVMFM
jgi:hypothetical protein